MLGYLALRGSDRARGCPDLATTARRLLPHGGEASRPVSVLSMRPIAPDLNWIQPPMCGRRSSRGGVFSSAPGMLCCPRLSAPPRLPPAPPALLPEAAWYIASLTAHSSQTFSPLSITIVHSISGLLQSRHTRPDPCRSVSFASRSPPTESLLTRLTRVPRPNLRLRTIHSSAALS